MNAVGVLASSPRLAPYATTGGSMASVHIFNPVGISHAKQLFISETPTGVQFIGFTFTPGVARGYSPKALTGFLQYTLKNFAYSVGRGP